MTTATSTSDGAFGVVGVLALFAGVLVFGYGVLLVPLSGLGGVWIAAVGLSLLLSGLSASERVRDRTGISPSAGRRLSLAFATLAVLLLVAFVLVNGATFGGGEASSA